MAAEKTPLEILNQNVEQAQRAAYTEGIRQHRIFVTKSARQSLDSILQTLKDPEGETDERATARHYLKNTIMWLGMDLKAIGEENPYPNSYNPASSVIEPTADRLKL